MILHTDEKARELIGDILEEADLDLIDSDDGELLLRWAEKATANPWIPVTERLPEQHERVLAYHPDWGVREGSCTGATIAGFWAGDAPATHWAPMPPPPC